MVEVVVNQNDGFVSITAVGGETDLDGDFPIYEKSHVTIKRTRSGTTTTLVLNTDYTIADNQLELTAGFTAVLAGTATPAVAGDVYTLLLNVPEERTTDFNQAGDFRASTINREFDLQTQQIQQLRRDVDKSARLPDTSTLTSLELPNPVASNLIGWNETADGLANYLTTDLTGTTVSAFAATLLDDTTAAQARTTLGVEQAPFVDSIAIIKGSADATKLIRIEADGLTTGTTRVWTAPDANLTVCDAARTITAAGLATGGGDLTTNRTITVTAATQSDMETATSTTTAVVPARQHFHPSAFKAWVFFTISGGTYTAQSSYNYTSFSKTATGKIVITWAVTMSSTNYGLMGTAGQGAARPCIVSQGAVHTSTTSTVWIVDMANNFDDPAYLFVGIVGDI